MEDDHLIIVNKPAGITTHPNSPEDADTLLHMVAGHLCVNGDIGFVRHVHRLDKDTTGAILFAKHPLSYSTLSYLLEKKKSSGHMWPSFTEFFFKRRGRSTSRSERIAITQHEEGFPHPASQRLLIMKFWKSIENKN